MQRVAFLSVLVLSLGCTGGSPGASDVELRFAPLVVAAGASPIAAQAQDTVSGNVDLARLGLAAVGAVYELTTPANRPFVFDLISRSDANTGAVRVSVSHAADGGAAPIGGPDSLTAAGVNVSATGITQHDIWLDSNGDGFARFTVRGAITRDQVIAVETENGAGKSTALVCVRIGPESEINIVDKFSGDYPGVLEELTLYSSDSWLFGLPTIAVSGDRTSIVVYEGDRANRIAPTNVRYELRMQYDRVSKTVTGGGSEERNVDWGNWRDHEIAALFNVLALVRSGTDRVTLRISFDRGATFLQEETLGQPLSPWTARLAQIAMAADYTLGVLFWQATVTGGTNLLLVEGRPSAFDGGGSPTGYAFDPPRVVHAVAGDVMPIIMGMTYSRGGDLAIGYAYSTMVRNEVNVTTTTSSFRSAVRLFGNDQFFDVLVDEDTIISKDPSVSVVGEGETMRVFYAYEGRNGIVLRTSEDAGRTWSGPIPIGDRSAHMATVIARETPTGNKLDVLYLAYSGHGLELHMRHWEDFDTEPPQTYRLIGAKIEYPATALSALPPGPSPRITEVAWFGYDAVLDGDDIVIVHHQVTHDGYVIALGLPTALGVPEPAPQTAVGGADFNRAEPPPPAPGMTAPLPAADPSHMSQLKVTRIR